MQWVPFTRGCISLSGWKYLLGYSLLLLGGLSRQSQSLEAENDPV